MSEAPAPRRYAAFISYRHADNLEPGRRWAEWLHQQLEMYEVPRDLVGKTNLRGEPVPASLYPVFRDEEELPAHADLSQNIQRALENSALLVVLCSPRAVQSRFVAEEIRAFKELGKSERVLALILDGEPNASDRPEDAARECLPEPLRYGVLDESGRLDWTRRTEPIAADVRPEGKPAQGYTSAAAYGDALEQTGKLSSKEIRRLEREYGERLELAKLKVIAGALAVPLGQLRARDAAYRAKRLRRAVAVLGSLAAIALAAAVMAVWQAKRAEQNFQQAEAARQAQQAQLVEASRHAHAAAAREFRAGHWPEGISLLGRALSYHPENRAAAAHLWSALAYGTGNRDEPPVGAWSLGAPIESVGVHPTGRWMAAGIDDSSLALVPLGDTRTTHDSVVRKITLPERMRPRLLRFHPTEAKLVFHARGLQWWMADWTIDPPQVVRLEGDYHEAVWSADGREILARGVLQGLAHLDPANGKSISVEGPATQIQLGAFFSPDGRYLVLQRSSQALEWYDLANGQKTEVPALEGQGVLIGSQLSPGGRLLAAFSGEWPSIFELPSGRKVFASPDGQRSWTAFAWGPQADLCLVTAADGTVSARSLPDAKELTPRLRAGGFATRAAFSKDGRRIYTGSYQGQVSGWSTPNSWTPAPRRIGTDPCLALTWLSGSRAALQVGETVQIWDAPAGKKLLTIQTGACPGGLAVDTEGRWLVTGGPGGKVSFWSPATGELIRQGHAQGFESYKLVFSGDGRRLFLSGADFSDGNPGFRFAVLESETGSLVGPGWRLSDIVIQSGMNIAGSRVFYRYRLNEPWQGWSLPDGAPITPVPAEDFDPNELSQDRTSEGRLGPTPSAQGETAYSALETDTGVPMSEPLGSSRGRPRWSPDGLYALVLEQEGVVNLYETPLPPPPGPWVRPLVEAMSGLSLKDSGFGVTLDPVARHAAREALAEAVPSDPLWGRLIRWLLADPLDRPAAP